MRARSRKGEKEVTSLVLELNQSGDESQISTLARRREWNRFLLAKRVKRINSRKRFLEGRRRGRMVRV